MDEMVDRERVCCMCGDVGFPDKLFRCYHCRKRFQHFNYYSELAEPTEICDWCRRLSSISGGGGSPSNRSQYSSGERIKENKGQETPPKSGGGGGAQWPRTATQRYKLLKDVMC